MKKNYVWLPALLAGLGACDDSPTKPADGGGVESIEVDVTPDSALLALDETVAAIAFVLVDGRTHSPPIDSITWSTLDGAVALVDDGGLVTGAGPGTTFVVASYRGAADSMTVAVLAGPAVLPTELAFTRTEADFHDEIYRMERDGSARALTDSDGANARPVWSPDGERIAFLSTRDGDGEIHVMTADGDGETNLTRTAGSDDDPVWSADGQRIAFVSQRDGDAEIYVMNADGSGQSNLTQHAGRDTEPTWSPDGGRIAFVSDRDGKARVWLMNADGSEPHRLTVDDIVEATPEWSPNGEFIAFLRYFTRGAVPHTETDLWIAKPDGSNARALTAERFSERDPQWSPDGSEIVYTRDFDDPEILVVRVSDGEIRPLTTLADPSTAPAWSPDGALIAFETTRDVLPEGGANAEIYTMLPTGEEQQNRTSYAGMDRHPAWRPRP